MTAGHHDKRQAVGKVHGDQKVCVRLMITKRTFLGSLLGTI
jgi:hypothetical protein